MKSTDYTTFQDRPKTFNAICMHIASYIFTTCMVNALM